MDMDNNMLFWQSFCLQKQILSSDARDLTGFNESESKGLGLFAKSNIPRGTRVIAEPPLLRVDQEEPIINDTLQAFERLPLADQELYLELHGYASDELKRVAEHETGQKWEQLPQSHRTILSIYASNAFANSSTGCHVYLLGSRINHSCVPNMNFVYNRELGKQTFHAIRDIEAGEELTVMYIKGTHRTRAQRQTELNRWGFQCTCPACEDTPQGREREKKRAELLDLDQKLAFDQRFGSDKTHRRGLQMAQKSAAIQKAEGLVNRELAVSYHEIATYCLKMKNAHMALLWVEKKLEVELYCVGEDHPDYKEELELVERLRRSVNSSEPLDSSVIDWLSYEPSVESCIVM